MSLPKSGSKDKISKVTKNAVKSKFKPNITKADKDKEIPGENPSSPHG